MKEPVDDIIPKGRLERSLLIQDELKGGLQTILEMGLKLRGIGPEHSRVMIKTAVDYLASRDDIAADVEKLSPADMGEELMGIIEDKLLHPNKPDRGHGRGA